MPTLDDAAEALVIKLKGLDSEIEESEHRLGDFRTRIEGASHEVDQEWAVLNEAVSSFLAKAHEEHDRLSQETQQALQTASDAQQAIATGGAEAHSEIEEGRAQLDTLAQHAAGIQGSVESLATEAGETPAQSLARHAAQIEQDLVHALEEARDFVHNDVVHGIEEVAHDIRDRCHALRTTLAEENTHALQATLDEWKSKVQELEDYVRKEGFLASHDHAHAYVDYALGECQAAYETHVDVVRQAVDVLGGQLQELASEVQRLGEAVIAQTGTDLTGRLDETHEGGATALSALGSVRDLLASYSFVQM